MAPEITSIEVTEFTWELEDYGSTANNTDQQYSLGHTSEQTAALTEVNTDTDVTGEFIFGTPPTNQLSSVADYLVGKNPLEREKHWNQMRFILKNMDEMALGHVDFALWDFAGKYYDAPIHELLGTYRTRLPAYASTYGGDPPGGGGLNSPEAYADFAETCLDHGLSGYKMHVWPRGTDLDRHIDLINTVGERVGDEMDLMLDPGGRYQHFGDALKIGRALDEQEFFWYEDPFAPGTKSIEANRKLRQRVDTPLLMAEHVHGVEAHADFVAHDATDFIRGNLWHGITGLMKVARMAEGFGVNVEIHGGIPACRHCMAAIRNTTYYELGLLHPEVDPFEIPVYKDYTDGIEAVDADGTVPVPNGPGMGVEYDYDLIEANTVNTRRFTGE